MYNELKLKKAGYLQLSGAASEQRKFQSAKSKPVFNERLTAKPFI